MTLLKQFTIDKNAVTRYHVIKDIGALYELQAEVFWKLVTERIKNESYKFVWSRVIACLDRRRIYEDEQRRLVNAKEDQQHFYWLIKPVLEKIMNISENKKWCKHIRVAILLRFPISS